ncbi:MAG: SH3 domain-containing protein [Deltaproteobacteria bacterium]|nr:SH3 domain-containing protein [Deltaproteobacteria bacterium]MBW2361151.1 SH3 domain-containing protein [Deltaproteobacteria bacterium]
MVGGAHRTRDLMLLASLALALPSCASYQAQIDEVCARKATSRADDSAVYRSASAGRDAHFESEFARLRKDLQQAEQQLAAIESGLSSTHTRADAVSAIADARIAVERANRRAAWRANDTAQARSKLAEAERQLEAGLIGVAVFFASRAARLASDIDAEATEVERHANARFVDAPRVNLRAGPSTTYRVIDVLTAATPVFPERLEGEWMLVRAVNGPVGWVHTALVRQR